MVDRPLEEVEPAIEELMDAAFLFPFDYVDEGYYDFRHQLLRDAIYDSVPTSRSAGSTPRRRSSSWPSRPRASSTPRATTSRPGSRRRRIARR